MADTKHLQLMLKRTELEPPILMNGSIFDISNDNNNKLPESPRVPMEFLSRSWSLPALQLSTALAASSYSSHQQQQPPPTVSSYKNTATILEESSAAAEKSGSYDDIAEEEDHHHLLLLQDQNNGSKHNKQRMSTTNTATAMNLQNLAGNSFSFASNAATSQFVLERIMSQSQDVSPLTSGRPSCSEPVVLTSVSTDHHLSLDSSPTLSPPNHHHHPNNNNNMEFDYTKLLFGATSTPQLPLLINRAGPKTGTSTPVAGGGGAGGKTMGRWLKERKEKKKEESRAHNAQLHAAVSVAAVAAAVAAAAAATAASSASSNGKDEQAALTDAAMASAATLVAARCVEAAEALGADHDHLVSVIGSAVNVQSHGDIMTLTAAAATALRGAATLKARAMKEVCNIAAVLPVAVEKSLGVEGEKNRSSSNNSFGSEPFEGDGGVGGLFNEELLARGCELLKRTRTGEFHWKYISVYINKTGQVILKMKSRHAAGTLTKKKKKVLMDVCRNMPAWPERCHVDGAEEKRYFGLKTVTHRVIQFECKNRKEHDVWTQGVSRLLSLASR